MEYTGSMIIRQNVLGVIMSRAQKYTTTFTEVEVYEDENIMSPMQSVRQGWEAAFHQMAAAGDDQLLDAVCLLTVDEVKEWEWF